jgi:hypothetical protein
VGHFFFQEPVRSLQKGEVVLHDVKVPMWRYEKVKLFTTKASSINGKFMEFEPMKNGV